jgi:phosphate transport system substrate-binding protein
MKKNEIFPLLVILVLIAGTSGCKKQTEVVTSGHRLVLAADPYLPLMQRQVSQYMSLYPEVKIEVLSTSSREAIVHLLNDSVHCIAIDRQLNEEEQQVARQASIKIVENKIAEDGVAIIVHKRNPVSSITIESVKRIITREAKNWDQVAGSRWSDQIDLVLTGRNSGMNELLQKKIFSVTRLLEPTTVLSSQNEVVQYVSSHPKSIGCVAASLIINEREKVKVLPVRSKSPEGEEQDYLPGQQEIYSSLYPFHYSLYLYNAESNTSVGIGFSAMVLSNIGQTIIQKAGLAPASIPYRTIQLYSE